MEGLNVAHFAEIKNDIVVNVINVSNADVDNLPFPESEPVGQEYLTSLGLTGTWLQTSYNNNFRGVYAGIGFSYDVVKDIFVAPIQPIPNPE